MKTRNLINKLKTFFRDVDEINRDKIIEKHEWEEKELRNMFALLVMGNYTGMPAPPAHITTELLPYMESDIHIMMERVNVAHDPFGELFSTLDPH